MAVSLGFGHGNDAPPTMRVPMLQRAARSLVPGADHLSVLALLPGAGEVFLLADYYYRQEVGTQKN